MIIGDQDALKPLREIKQKLESELMERDGFQQEREGTRKIITKRRDLKNIEYGELTDFASRENCTIGYS